MRRQNHYKITTTDDFHYIATQYDLGLDRSLQFAIFNSSKTGGVSIKRTLLKERIVARKDGELRRWFILRCMLKHGRPKLILVIRNPFDRLVSAYFYLKGKGKIMYDFDSFVFNLAKVGPRIDRHLWAQERYHVPIKYMGIDHVIPFESLEAGWTMVAQSLGLPDVLPHMNKSLRPAALSELYTKPTADVIRQVYSIDFEGLGYDPWGDFDAAPAFGEFALPRALANLGKMHIDSLRGDKNFAVKADLKSQRFNLK